MPQENDILKKLTTRVRQLILMVDTIKKENQAMYETLKKKDEETIVLKQQIAQLKADYEHLKMSKMIELSHGDIKEAKAKLTKLIKDVNKSIALLNAE